MRLALVTCAELPDWEVDDRAFHAALSARGVDWSEPAWTDSDVDWASFDAALIRTTWDYWDRPGEFAEWVVRTAAQTRLFNPSDVVLWNLDKRYLRALEATGLRLAPTIWLAPGARANVRALCREREWARAFLKPVVGASAHETLRFNADAAGLRAAQTHVDRLLAREHLMLQPYLASVETEGELSVICVDGEIAHGVRKVPVPGDYRVQDDYGAHDEPWSPAPDETELARRAVTAAGELLELDAALLYARVDFLRDGAGRLCLNELELVEPSLFFRHGPATAERLADAWLARLGGAAQKPRS